MRKLATVIFFCVSTLIFQHCRAEFDKTKDKKADLTGKTSVEKHGKLMATGLSMEKIQVFLPRE